MNKVAALIPAAGFSSRMGAPKALLRMADGRTFAGYLTQKYLLAGCNPVILVIQPGIEIPDLNSHQVTIVRNPQPELGRSHSIHLGIEKVPHNCACFLHNIDSPYLSEDLLKKLSDCEEESSYCVPVYESRGGHPVLLGKKIVKTLRNNQTTDDFRMILKNFRKTEVKFLNNHILLNINTFQDYEKWKKKNHTQPHTKD
jgi:CTP:molybdopterin cytidylyltransferase MocA